MQPIDFHAIEIILDGQKILFPASGNLTAARQHIADQLNRQPVFAGWRFADQLHLPQPANWQNDGF